MRICLTVITERLQLQTAACRGREPCKELLSLSARFAHLWSHPPARAALSHSCYINEALSQPPGSASPLQSLCSWAPPTSRADSLGYGATLTSCNGCLRSYCICWHVCTLCSLCLQKQTDEHHFTQQGDPKGQPTFGPHSEHCTSSCKPTLLCGRLWRLPNFAPPAFGFHWNESRCSHGCPNRSLPDQLWIKSNHQLIA